MLEVLQLWVLLESLSLQLPSLAYPLRDQSDFPHANNPVKENRNLRTQESLFHSSWGVKSKKLFLSELSGKKKEHFGEKKILSL